MEAGLTKLQDVWAKVEFKFTQHRDSGVFTVKMAEEDFEVRGVGVHVSVAWGGWGAAGSSKTLMLLP